MKEGAEDWEWEKVRRKWMEKKDGVRGNRYMVEEDVGGVKERKEDERKRWEKK